MEWISTFLADPIGKAVYAAVVAAFVDFAFGVFAAARDGTFAIDALAAFVRKHLLGRVFPVSLLALVAYSTGDAVMAAAAIGSLSAYAIETLGSIYGSIKPPADVREIDELVAVNPVPTD